MQKSFLYIDMLFDSDNNRTIDTLKLIYEDSELLKEKIHKLIVKDEDFIESVKGKKVLLKPNWVMHSLKESDELCLRTNDNFLLAVVDVILDLKPERIMIADAPIQLCEWDKMINKEFINNLGKLSLKHGIPVSIKDIRRVIYKSAGNKISKGIRPINEYVIFDLGKDSFLEEISSDNKTFRVTNYNPDRLAEAHSKGVHKYCISKELFENDVVILVPKIKTHQKTGITGALKNLVGINGDKDYLPHHRVGGTGFGGDCYPGRNVLRRLSENFLDSANRNLGNSKYNFYKTISIVLWRINKNSNYHRRAAGWYGNDTTWRMVSDLNKIAENGLSDGTLSKIKIRNLFSISDGIIGGQGDGPIRPDPLPLGLIAFTNSSALNDAVMAKIMGFEFKNIPLLFNMINTQKIEQSIIEVNETSTNYIDIIKYRIETIPPPGWVDHIN